MQLKLEWAAGESVTRGVNPVRVWKCVHLDPSVDLRLQYSSDSKGEMVVSEWGVWDPV